VVSSRAVWPGLAMSRTSRAAGSPLLMLVPLLALAGRAAGQGGVADLVP